MPRIRATACRRFGSGARTGAHTRPGITKMSEPNLGPELKLKPVLEPLPGNSRTQLPLL